MPAAAIVGAAAIGTVGNAVAGNKAAKAQKQAASQADATNRYIYDQNRADYAPFREVGYGALGKLAQMYGVTPVGPNGAPPGAATSGVASPHGGRRTEGSAALHQTAPTGFALPAQSGEYGGFMESPGYRFRVDEATKAIERSAAARGGLRSGATMDSLQRRVQGVASDEYENFANRLASLAGVGQTATNATSAAGQAYAGQQTQTNLAAGNARASAYLNTGQAINNGIGNVASAYLYGQGGGFGGGGGAPSMPRSGWDTPGIY